MMLRSPFKWVGGKSRLRRSIIPLFPVHDCYVEPFGGAAWVLMGKSPSPVEVLNDIDGELVNFFRVVKHDPEALIESFDLELVSRKEYDRLAALPTDGMTDLERAHRFYYLIMAGWGGEGLYPRFQTSIHDSGGGNRLIGAIRRLRERIEPVHRRLQGVIIENLDYRECMDRYDSPSTLMYLDPPYVRNGVNYTYNLKTPEEHAILAETVRRLRCRWILSGYDTDEMREWFDSYNIIEVAFWSGMNTGAEENERQRTLNREILVLNYDPPDESEQQVRSASVQGTLFGATNANKDQDHT